MPVGRRGLSSRQTQQAVRDWEIGQPNNSETCSETADGVARKSEGGSRLSLLRPVRQDQPRRHTAERALSTSRTPLASTKPGKLLASDTACPATVPAAPAGKAIVPVLVVVKSVAEPKLSTPATLWPRKNCVP